MNCDEARKRWHSRLDDGGEDEELDRHVRVCEVCRRYDGQMRHLVGALAELRTESEGVSFPDDRSSAIQSSRSTVSHWNVRRLRVVRVAAALALMVAGALYLGDRLTGRWVTGPMQGGDTTPPIVAEAHHPTVRLRGNSAEKYLAVSATASESDVQVFWLYPLLTSGNSDDPS